MAGLDFRLGTRAMYMPTIICNSRLFVTVYYYIYMPTLFADFMTSYNESTTYLKGSGKVRPSAD